MQPLNIAQQQQILQLRLLIARAAQLDSLNWWEDNSLTEAGNYLLERVFVFAKEEAARKLALEAAVRRYQGAFGEQKNMLHLFRLEPTGELDFRLRKIDLASVDIPLDPIPTLDALKQRLLTLIGEPPAYKVIIERGSHQLEIRLRSDKAKQDLVHLAQAFAWASLESKPGHPVFPYILENS